ncbi:hypothetical protein [Streptomyces sp. NPDC046985]|uniref:hypothetical protein n=1 Tax=Streptomyces sp. NPDC046985 TaxID=3155377 RepID=UPI0033CCA70B
MPLDEASEHFGSPFTAAAHPTDAPASSAHTPQMLGWTPTHAGLLDDLENGDCLPQPTGATADRWT